jgi:hypothetical protein
LLAIAAALAPAHFLDLKKLPSLGGCERQTGWGYQTAGQPGTSRSIYGEKTIKLGSGMWRA